MTHFIVAITGGIASGKSTVASLFARLGRDVIDADRLARELVEPGQPALAEIAARFGEAALQPDGRLDRGWMRAHVFADPEARKALEAILHPRIRSEMQRRANNAPGPYALADIPLLAEGGGRAAYPWLARILVVDAPHALQLARVQARDGSSAEQATTMLAAQVPRAARLAIADDVIVNSGPLSALDAAVTALDRRYLALAGAE
ncbi:MAG TPA: dephospho-CoA kinase [Arenimonas sp.]|nr:dephospho-CoA kinase [Arenimonas sp.]